MCLLGRLGTQIHPFQPHSPAPLERIGWRKSCSLSTPSTLRSQHNLALGRNAGQTLPVLVELEQADSKEHCGDLMKQWRRGDVKGMGEASLWEFKQRLMGSLWLKRTSHISKSSNSTLNSHLKSCTEPRRRGIPPPPI